MSVKSKPMQQSSNVDVFFLFCLSVMLCVTTAGVCISFHVLDFCCINLENRCTQSGWGCLHLPWLIENPFSREFPMCSE